MKRKIELCWQTVLGCDKTRLAQSVCVFTVGIKSLEIWRFAAKGEENVSALDILDELLIMS
jgi:hypothetical protein